MKASKHDIILSIDKVKNKFFFSIKVIGKLTHEDYKILIPKIDTALKDVENPTIKAFIDCTELTGWDLEVVWDDLKLGIKHNNKFEKIAILGDQNWLNIGSEIASWFIHADLKYFADDNEALYWLNS